MALAGILLSGCQCGEEETTATDTASSTSTTGGETSTSTTGGETSTSDPTTTTSDPTTTTTGEVDPCADLSELCFELGPAALDGVQIGDLALYDAGDDAYPDVVAASAQGLSLLINDGSGSLTVAQTVGAGHQWIAVAVGDVDDDGDLDVVGAGIVDDGMSKVTDLLVALAEDGQLGEPTPIPMAGASSLALADIDGDGDLDVVATIEDAGVIALYAGDGGGGFVKDVETACGTAPAAVVVTPIDDDAIADVVVANFGSNGLATALVSGGALAEVTTQALGGSPRGLAAAALAPDSRDLVVVSEGEDLLEIFVASGDGGLVDGGAYPLADIPRALVVGDFNGGGEDVAVALRGLGVVAFYLGDDEGGLQAYTSYGVIADPSAMVATRFNADNRLDVAVASEGAEGGVRLLLSVVE